MLARLLLLFIVVPLVELTLLLYLARWEGPLFTIALVIGTGALGAFLARRQGWQTVRRIQQDLAIGRLPGDALLDGLLIFLAGALLITPGILTDAVGFLLLVPLCRRWFKARLMRWLKSRVVIQTHVMGDGPTVENQGKIVDSYVVDSHSEPAQTPDDEN